jgi:hypothetical protein
MPEYNAHDIDKITTWTGVTAAVCLGLASTLASVLASVPGDKVMGIDKIPLTAASSVLGGVGAIALGIKSVFTNKPATLHPTTTDLEEQANIQDQADFYKYNPNSAPPSPLPRPAHSIEYPTESISPRSVRYWDAAFDDEP